MKKRKTKMDTAERLCRQELRIERDIKAAERWLQELRSKLGAVKKQREIEGL